MNNKLIRLMLVMSVSLFSFVATFGQSTTKESSTEPDVLFPNADLSLGASHFTWGADIGTSIDLSGYDSSTFDVDANIGYKNRYLRLLGIGAGFHRSLGSGDNYIPLYAILRTSFAPTPKLFFLSLKAGYSFNTIGDAPTYGDITAAAGIGLNLAVSDKFKTHIVLGYEFRHFNKRHRSLLKLEADNISLASLSFGISF